MGPGDLHDAFYDDTAMRIPLRAYIDPGITPTVPGHCEYTFITYSSAEYAGSDNSNVPTIVAASICIIFSFIALAFILYDCFIQRRNNIVLDTATKSHAILSSLFPSNVRDRLYAEKTGESASGAYTKGGSSSLKTLLNSGNMMGGASGEEDAEMGYKGKPIADLFTESTVLFADIAGFTAWSSVREPAQVFTLLESLYRAFDEIAKRRGVFKVETIGDCYVAVTGVPEPQKDHAVIMCRFARDMMNACRTMTKRLETKLGPDTGDLDMRVGIHSGPVTAGVLRGERSRFQLFGDTMNTASRTESTGLKGKIQLSQETADFLITAGKSYWIRQREEKVFAKGKGEMTTYWLSIKKEGNAATSSASDSGTVEIEDDGVANAESFEISHNDKRAQTLSSEKTIRLIEWNCDVLLRLIKQIAARRISTFRQSLKSKSVDEQKFLQSSTLAIDEVQEIVKLPEFDIKNGKDVDKDSIVLEPVVVEQLFDYVSNIAAMYRDNHFHNFEHASHVTMSVTKLLSRIVAPSHIDAADGSGKALHDHTYGITSDPLTQFACVFSALIHDVDHCGVPNAQLIKEHAQIAEYYQGKSVAEQNSVDIAWHLLMDDSYADLRKAIYTTNDEFQRFRQLVVNSVMATDIVDKELKTLRNKRWEKAFSETAVHENAKDSVDRKATIVIEHLIQASDVSHTMQHWHIYRKWNERFFMECYQADKDGRAENDPSESWYTGEIGFYDFYIIPLAKKLKDCGVFGVSSDEYLNYAQRNRSEWEARGQEVVQEMIEKAQNGIAKGSRITKNG
jgi:class 3 adenylate cyclase